ncbi:TlyA family RNA methyltransferase [Rubrimonas cliftonensis]|uniref:23S rRNA (Cytidine1920-2'-O)/16S rRNA (Cytidine1409-2'-O)-methyltransferase n=1 Tax=Rubrimonas cliftonensis TaxID=89524 RepID=A0A1H4CL13_9RHOB|nr:TlyA family RNA methyltransferase [Rubrimonas cliftonensis]SEA61003.1 23S rRNA (cytidine1920-2'-O)/16S rRNA (cytidine1409-2'-O)-methyltransferase [Rubrimonas cliftonensis]
MRLDQRLVALGLAGSRARAQALIAEGLVSVDGAPARRASQATGDGAEVALSGPASPWVGRGALKLLHGLDVFGLDPTGARALDVGASTGGFTQALLARGAAHVWALDVGHGQLAPALAQDPRVTSIEGVNARDMPEDLVPVVSWIVADVSFISLTLALPRALARGVTPGATLVALVKPQFEAGRAAVGRGGVVRDPAAREAACARVSAFLAASGWPPIGLTESPIAGGDGNVEFLVAARRR